MTPDANGATCGVDGYQEFLARKAARAPMRGLATVPAMSSNLFPFQAQCVEFLLRIGSGGLFLDTGLGKTICELEWCAHAAAASNGRALILTPLAVAHQIRREAERFGYQARVIRQQSDAGDGINICNYDRLDLLNPAAFGAVALDESSILKSFGGKTTTKLIDTFRDHRWKIAATATPAPNDHMELGTHAEFLSVMASNEMLSRFFINDTSTASQKWRIKGHAERPFWDWLASWSRMAKLPSDLGPFSDDGYVLPPLNVVQHKAENSNIDADTDLADMFGAVNMSATNLHDVKRRTITNRADVVAGLVDAEPAEAWVIWCDTDYESSALADAVTGAVEIKGSQSIEVKEERIARFLDGDARYVICKPSMMGYGLNLQHAARMVFAGRSYSYETYYQAVRRCWRFGQKRQVDVHLVIAEGENEIGRVIDRKAEDHGKMKSAMAAAMRRAVGQSSETKIAYNPTFSGRLPTWL